jgi:NADH-quinone oxidoreductase subunit E
MLSEDTIKEIEEISRTFPHPRSALTQALFIAQKKTGYLTSEVMEAVAKTLDIPPVHVRGAATFYSLYKLEPVGRHIIQICTNISCMISGSEKIVAYLGEKYALKPGETTKDGRFSLMIMDCIGSCASGPAMLISDCMYDNLTEERLDEILTTYT